MSASENLVPLRKDQDELNRWYNHYLTLRLQLDGYDLNHYVRQSALTTYAKLSSKKYVQLYDLLFWCRTNESGLNPVPPHILDNIKANLHVMISAVNSITFPVIEVEADLIEVCEDAEDDTTSKKRTRSSSIDSSDDEQKNTKIPRINETPEVKKEEPVIEEIEEWMMPQKKLCTLTVHVKVFKHDRNKHLEKEQTQILHLHCSPGVLASHSKWFAVALEDDPNLPEISIPDSFTWRDLWKGPKGYVAPQKDQILCLFKILHGGEWTYTKFYLESALMLHYLDCPVLYRRYEALLGSITGDHWAWLAWGDHFNSEHIFKAVSAIRSTKVRWSATQEEMQMAVNAVPPKTLAKLCMSIAIGPNDV